MTISFREYVLKSDAARWCILHEVLISSSHLCFTQSELWYAVPYFYNNRHFPHHLIFLFSSGIGQSFIRPNRINSKRKICYFDSLVERTRENLTTKPFFLLFQA
jgi:hypothetical protein